MAASAETPLALSGAASTILSFNDLLQEYGAETWNLRAVAVVSAAFFYLVRILLRKRGGVDWYPLTHATLTGVGSAMCIYLDFFWAEQLTGLPEPIRNARCGTPLTSLHRIIPGITMGYSLLDFLDGLTIGPEFIAHGAATFSVMAYFNENNISHLMTPMLLMEISSIFLALVRAKSFSPNMLFAVQLVFVVTFFICRVALVPYLWFERVLATLAETKLNPEYNKCIPDTFVPVIPLFGLFFHTLNFYWFCKIIKKMYRKMTGVEKIDEKNDFGDEDVQKEK